MAEGRNRGRRGGAPGAGICFVALGLGLALAAAGCSRKEIRAAAYQDPHPIPAAANVRDVEGRHGGRFVYVTIGDPKTLNPLLASETSSSEILRGPLFAALTFYNNADQTMEPGLARAWERSRDGLSYVFHLRPGVRWSDGEPLDADDVLFSAAVYLDPSIPSAVKSLMTVAGRSWAFEKIDSLTVRVVLPAPFGPVPEVLSSFYVVPEHKLGQAFRDGRFEEMWAIDTPPASIVTNGPFVLAEFRPGEKAVLARNPHYWEVDRNGLRLPYLESYVFLIVKDLNTMALKFQSGETDLIDPIIVDQVPLFEDEQAKGAYRVVDLGGDVATDFMWLNQNPGRDPKGEPHVAPWKMALFRDVRFRRAISHAVNREGLVKSVLQGRGRPLYAPYTETNRQWFNPNVPRFPYDPAKAKALLDEMGLEDRNGDGIRETANGHRVEFTLHTNAENNLRRSFGAVIVEDLARVGVRVNFHPLEFNTLVTRMREDYTYEAILLGFTSPTPPDPALSANLFRSSGISHGWNPEQKSPSTEGEAEMDRLMDAVVGEPAFERRKDAFDRVQSIMGENQYLIYVVNRNLYVGIRNRVEGARPSVIRQHVTWNIQELWVRDAPGALAARQRALDFAKRRS